MMSKVENPATGEEITVIKGIVERVMFKEAVNDKFGATHRASVLIDGDWVGNISIKTKENYEPQIRFNNGNNAKPDWQTLEVGDEVRLVVTENEYNNKIYYNSGTSKIKLVKKGEGTAKAGQQRAPQGSQNASGSSTSFKKDSIGVLQGHALKGGGMLVARDIFDKDDILSAAKFYHHITKNVKEWYTENSEGLSEYDIGNGAGNAVNTAAQYAGMDEIESEAIKILQLLPKLSEFIKNGNEAVKEEKKPAQKPKPQPKPVEQELEEEFDDEMLPF